MQSKSTKATCPSPKTNKPFMKDLQKGVSVVLSKDAAGHEVATMRDGSCLVEFDRIYKPYVLHILKNVYHFSGTTTHSPEDIYHDVLVELLSGLLARFDFDGEHVGQGAFRSYLKMLIRGAYFKHLFPELIPELDKNGDPVYLKEYEKDRSGKVKLDSDGNPVRKVKRISRTQFLSEQAVMAKAEGAMAMFKAQSKPHEGLSAPVVKLAIVAYVKAIYEKEKNGKAKWRLDAMKSVFEDGRSPQEVSEELQKNGIITDRRAFDTAKSIFMDEWESLRYALQEPVIESTIDGEAVRVVRSKTGKVTVKLPRTVDSRGRGTYSREVRRRMRVDHDALSDYIEQQRQEAIGLVGKERFDKINESVMRSMILLVQEADEKEAEKRGRNYT